MKDKNKKILIYGGAAAGILYLVTRGDGVGGWGGGFGGTGVGSEGGGGLAETMAGIIPESIPFIGAPEPDAPSKKGSDYTEAQYGSAASTGEYAHSLFYGDPNAQRRADAQYDRDYPAKKSESMTEKVKSDVKLPGVTGAGFWDMLFGGTEAVNISKWVGSKVKTPTSTTKSSGGFIGTMRTSIMATAPVLSGRSSGGGGGGTYPSKKASDYTSGQYGSAAGEGEKAHKLFGGY